MEQKQVTIYSTPTCHFCLQAKAFFKENDIEYIEHDVATDKDMAKEMVDKSGQMGVPVIFVGDDMAIGFDEARLRELLAL